MGCPRIFHGAHNTGQTKTSLPKSRMHMGMSCVASTRLWRVVDISRTGRAVLGQFCIPAARLAL
eukprot:9174880-Pyramimonas_sp.AAC.1